MDSFLLIAKSLPSVYFTLSLWGPKTGKSVKLGLGFFTEPNLPKFRFSVSSVRKFGNKKIMVFGSVWSSVSSVF